MAAQERFPAATESVSTGAGFHSDVGRHVDVPKQTKRIVLQVFVDAHLQQEI